MFTVYLHHIVHCMLLIHIINIMWFILYNTSLSINHSLNVTNTIIVVYVRCCQSLQKIANLLLLVRVVVKSVHARHLFNRCFRYTPFILNLPVCLWPDFYQLRFIHVTFLQFGALFTSHSTGLPSVNCPLNSLHTSLI